MMKSSTRRCSLGSIQSSGLKASGAFPRGTCAAIWQGRSETSKFSTRPAPDSLARSPRPASCAPCLLPDCVLLVRRFGRGAPRGRRPDAARAGQDAGPCIKGKNVLAKGGPANGCARPPLLFGRRLLKVFDSVADGDDRLGLVVGNLDAELLFERHHQLYGVERVGAQIVDEIGAVDDFVGLHAEVLDDDLLHPLCDIAHVIFSLMRRALPPDF